MEDGLRPILGREGQGRRRPAEEVHQEVGPKEEGVEEEVGEPGGERGEAERHEAEEEVGELGEAQESQERKGSRVSIKPGLENKIVFAVRFF